MAKGKYEYWLTDDGLIKLEGWARDGLIDEQIAQNMGITRSTLNDWKNKYADISNTIKRGKEVVDRQVENVLLKSAMGYTTSETTYQNVEGELIPVKVIKKEIAPNPVAMIFWLKNRKPENWRDYKAVEVIEDNKRDGMLKDILGALDVKKNVER